MNGDNLYDELESSFIELHKAQLKSSRLPEIYWKSLFRKIQEEVRKYLITRISL